MNLERRRADIAFFASWIRKLLSEVADYLTSPASSRTRIIDHALKPIRISPFALIQNAHRHQLNVIRTARSTYARIAGHLDYLESFHKV
jgi:hypothetical protein